MATDITLKLDQVIRLLQQTLLAQQMNILSDQRILRFNVNEFSHPLFLKKTGKRRSARSQPEIFFRPRGAGVTRIPIPLSFFS